jgi:hexosaminidase
MVAHETTGCTVTDSSSNLMPAPALRALRDGVSSAAAALPAQPRFAARFAMVASERLRAAVARLQAAVDRAQVTEGSRERAVGSAAGGGPAVEVPLVIDVAEAGSAFPALDDDERYRLEIDSGGIVIAAPAEWGALRALTTLAQLWLDGLPPAPQVIEDRPRFPWRGLMLDPARHFLPLDVLLRTVDGMALFKLNVLHLHLSDDQGFRFASRRYPELASAEHYSRAELGRLVAYAADLGIRVVPELDVPGHAAAWLGAHPEWGNRAPAPTRRFGVHRECLDPTRPAVRDAVAALFGELAEVFPDAYVHLGGDEVHPDWWSGDPAIEDFMAGHGLADVADLQAWFTGFVAERLEELGRIPLGWDEVLHRRLPAGVAVQAWRGATARDRALDAGHDCVLSAPYYLDLFYPADVHYGFDPAADAAELLAREDALLADPRFEHVARGMAWTRQWREVGPPRAPASRPGRLLGAEACLWSELVDPAVLDLRLWSRMPALAERFWSPPGEPHDSALRSRLATAQRWLAPWCGIDLARARRAGLSAAGVDQTWLPLVDALEPVKWYGRLLGETALAARLAGREMPQARPYDADTPLNRPVDFLPPESLVTGTLLSAIEGEMAGDASARQRLRELAAGWQALPADPPEELAAAAAALRELGACLLGLLDGALAPAAARAQFRQAARPRGEYLLAPAPLLLVWLDRRETAAR